MLLLIVKNETFQFEIYFHCTKTRFEDEVLNLSLNYMV